MTRNSKQPKASYASSCIILCKVRFIQVLDTFYSRLADKCLNKNFTFKTPHTEVVENNYSN